MAETDLPKDISENTGLTRSTEWEASRTVGRYVIDKPLQCNGGLNDVRNEMGMSAINLGAISIRNDSRLKPSRSFSRRQKYTLSLITLTSFWIGVAFSLLGPFYPVEAMRKGMNLTTVGIVFGMFEIVTFLTAPFFGSNLVKIGPEFLFLSGFFVGGSCNILFGVLTYCPSGTPFIVMSILIRSVEAVGFSGYTTASFAIISSQFKENVSFTFGILRTSSGLGLMLGPVIGGVLYDSGGFGLPFYCVGVSVLLSGFAVYRFLPPVENPSVRRKGSILTLLRSPMVTIPLCSVLVSLLGITSFETTFAKHIQPLGLSTAIVGVLFGVVAGAYALMSSILGYVSDRKDIRAPLFVVGHSALAVGFFMIGPSVFLPFLPWNTSVIVIGAALIGVSLGCVFIPTVKCMLVGAVELGFEDNIDTCALVSGLFNCVQHFGGFVGPMAVGYLAEELDIPTAYTVVGMCSSCMMVVSLGFFTVRRFRRQANLPKDCERKSEKSDAET